MLLSFKTELKPNNKQTTDMKQSNQRIGAIGDRDVSTK